MMVTAIMITGKDPSRRPLAEASLRCFLSQTYLNRELIIINDGEPILKTPIPNGVREVVIKRNRRRTLGDLRNIGLDLAKGDAIVQWDDDDWYHPDRIALQAKALTQIGVAVLLRRQLRCNIITRAAYIYDSPTGIHGTVLHHAGGDARYPSSSKGEDSYFLRWFRQIVVVDLSPIYYVRLFHGSNTWDEYHVMGALAGLETVGFVGLNREETIFLMSVLQSYYASPRDPT